MPVVSQGTAGVVTTTGPGTLVIGAGSTATFDSITVGQNSGDAGVLRVDGTLNIAANGVLDVASSTALSGAGTINLAAGSTVNYASTATSTFDGSISGAGGLEVDSGTLTLDGINNSNNNYGGTTAVDYGGTLQLANGATLGDGTSALQVNGTLDMNGNGATVTSLTGAGAVENTSPDLVPLTIANDTADNYSGEIGLYGNIDSAISLQKEGPGTLELSSYNYMAATEIDAGTLQLNAFYAIRPGSALEINGGALDLNGNSVTVSSLNGDGGTITDYSSLWGQSVQVDGDGFASSSVFGGTILNGPHAQIALYVTDTTLTLANINNTYSAGTTLSDGHLVLGDGINNGMVTGLIQSTDEDSVVFDVAAGTSETFSGYIRDDYPSTGYGCAFTKTGAGKLVLSPSAQDVYQHLTTVNQGTLTLGNSYALVSAGDVTIQGAATLDLGGLSDLPTVGDVTLTDGIITNGTLAASGMIDLGYGEIDADLSGSALVDKVQSTVSPSILGVSADTVVVGASSDSGVTGQIDVTEGTLTVNGTLGTATSTVQVGSASSSPIGALDGGGTLPGSVIIADSGVLSLGTSTGTSTITIGSLKLQAGSTVDDNVGSQDYLAQITGALTINGGTVKTANGGAAGSVPYQVLFQYGWLTSNGGAGFSNLSSNSDLINNLPASSIDVLLSGTPLYWAPSGPGSFGGNGEWDGASGNWLTSPTGGTANWTDGDVAIFEGTGTVTLADGFTAKPAAMLFVGGNYQIVTSGSTTNPGKISEPTGATTILVALASGLQATISPAVACGNLIADLPDGALILNGDESNVANATVNCTSAGTLQLGDGSSDDLLPGSAAAGSIVFNNSSTAPASLIFDTSTLSWLSASQECYYGISGNATITEDGPGSLTLNEADTNAGGTVVTSGTLVATNPEAIPNGWSLTVGYGPRRCLGLHRRTRLCLPHCR